MAKEQTKIIFFEDKAEIYRRAADLIAMRLTALLDAQPYGVLATAAGQTLEEFWRALANREGIDWSRVHLFLADERMVPLTDPRSNYRAIKQALASAPLGGEQQPQFYPFFPERGTPAYEQLLSNLGGRFDIVLLSMGEDGHVASLFPNHPALQDTEGMFVLVDGAPKPPPHRMSASVPLLMHSGLGVLFVCGEAKREAFERFKQASTAPIDCPAKLVSGMGEKVVFTDLGDAL